MFGRAKGTQQDILSTLQDIQANVSSEAGLPPSKAAHVQNLTSNIIDTMAHQLNASVTMLKSVQGMMAPKEIMTAHHRLKLHQMQATIAELLGDGINQNQSKEIVQAETSLTKRCGNADSPHIMDHDEFRQSAKVLVDWIIDYRKKAPSLPVRSRVEPGYLFKILPTDAPAHGESWDSIMADLDSAIMPGITHWQSPNFFAYFKPHASYPSVLGELLCAGMNVMGFSWISSPACTELETIVLNWLGRAMQLPDAFLTSGEEKKGGGVIQGSAGEACIVSVLAAKAKALDGLEEQARHDAAGKLTMYFSDQAHSVMQNACMILGIEQSRCRVLPTTADDKYALQANVLEEAILQDKSQGLRPFMVVGTMGTTSSCAMDPLKELASVAKQHGMWMHVDAAYGGSYCVCPEFRPYLNGIEDVDSLVINAHKKLLTNFDCAANWFQDRKWLIEALALEPEYLRNKASASGEVIDYKDWQLPLGRRFRALKLWFVMRSYGIEGLRWHIRNGVNLASKFEKWVGEHRLFELVLPRSLALVCFRLKGSEDQNQQLLDNVNNTGKIFLIHTKLSGKIVLRLAVGGHEQCEADVASAWDIIQQQAESLLGTNSEK